MIKGYIHTMVQTAGGASRNPWLRQIKRCAAAYHEENEARAKLPRRRLNDKSPEDSLYVRPKPVAAAPAAPKPAPAKPAPKPPEAEARSPKPAAAAAARPERMHLQKYVAAARKFLETHERVTAAALYNEIAKQGDFRKDMELAGLPTKAVIASFVKAFPQFKLETTAKGGASHVALA
ncbi:MAG: hypothetical protein B7Z80_26035 [Rhodospirillales bacterium 20-64-7]|nr:MAG: hypothetical protein B7Z80_26035 [Rhodospirillales bacterium 20-64-7]